MCKVVMAPIYVAAVLATVLTIASVSSNNVKPAESASETQISEEISIVEEEK